MEKLYLGIDGGASKCKAVITNQNLEILGLGLSGSANYLLGENIVINSILEATNNALKNANLNQNNIKNLIAGIGLAGLNIPQNLKKFKQWKSPFKKFYLTTDLDIALTGALNNQNGAIIIIGTGSCGLIKISDKKLAIGGHGLPYGDNGSGAWFGIEILRLVLLSLDGLIEKTLLTKLLKQRFSFNNGISLINYFLNAKAKDFAKLSILVFEAAEQNDKLALNLINQGAEYINKIARKLIEFNAKNSNEDLNISLIGGLSLLIKNYLDIEVKNKIKPALYNPEIGAILFAKNCEINNLN